MSRDSADAPRAAPLAIIVATKTSISTIDIIALEPPIQYFMEIVQVLRVAVALALARTRIVLGDAPAAIHARVVPSCEPAIVGAQRTNRVPVSSIQSTAEVRGTAVHVVLDRVVAVILAVDTVPRMALHQPRRRSARIGIARRLLHGDESKDSRVDIEPLARTLEELVVLGAVGSYAAVVIFEGDVREIVDVEIGRFPTVVAEARVEPLLGAVGSTGAVCSALGRVTGPFRGLRGGEAGGGEEECCLCVKHDAVLVRCSVIGSDCDDN